MSRPKKQPATPTVYTLSDDEKQTIRELYATTDLIDLAQKISGNAQEDGRSPCAHAVREYVGRLDVADEDSCAAQAVLPKPAAKGLKAPVILTESQKEEIATLYQKVENTIELTRMVFKNPAIQQMSMEYRAVWAYTKEVYPKGVSASDQMVDDSEYEPPGSLAGLCGLVNEHVSTGTTKKLYSYPLKPHEDRQLRSLMSYMRTLRFRYQVNQYDRQIDRNLYISTFIRFTHDKTDLTPEEQDQYMSAAAETINIIQIERGLQNIERRVNEILSGDHETRGQEFMATVELINATRGKLDQSKKTLQGLIDGLVGTRSKRIKDRENRSSTILNLFSEVMTSGERRKELAAIGRKEKEEDARVAGELRDADDIMALIAGMTFEEAAS